MGEIVGGIADPIVAELARLGLLVARDGRTELDPRVRELARSSARTPADLIESAKRMRASGRTSAAVDALTKALASLGDAPSAEQARALHMLGLARRDSGDVAGSLEAHERSEYVYASIGDQRGRARALCAIGRIELEQGCLARAQERFNEVIGLGDTGQAVIADAGLVEVRARRGDTAEAIETLERGLALARSEGFRDAEAATLNALAYVHDIDGDVAASDAAYLAASDLLRTHGAHRAMVALHTMVAERRALRGDAVRAEQAIRAAEAVVGARGPQSLAHIAIARGTLLETRLDLTGALAAYWEAADAAERCAATYLQHKAAVLSARLDPDRARAAQPLRSALLALAADGDRGPLTGRPALASWLAGLVDELAFVPAQRASVVDLLSSAATSSPATAASRPADVQVSLFGTLEVRIGGEAIAERAWRTSKAKELFVLLLLERERALGRDEIIERLWPEVGPENGVSSFHFTLHALRKALASTGVTSGATVRTDTGYQLVVAGKPAVDADVFQLLLHEADRLRRAARVEDACRLFRATAALYRGDLLTELEGEWVAERREDLLRQYLSAVRQLAELELELGDGVAAATACRTFMRREPYDERIHRLLMRAYHASGDTALVKRHYASLTETLRRDVGTAPEHETTALFEKLRGRSRLGLIAAPVGARS